MVGAGDGEPNPLKWWGLVVGVIAIGIIAIGAVVIGVYVVGEGGEQLGRWKEQQDARDIPRDRGHF